ncbi:fimbrial protein [Enterobacter sp.]|uniref:fimbrial protein n=1 Tax=Enterobacter sp. TaxID=42895 RepID=UPI00296F9298|nr:fimbrial protein [Enterobacter sp.]
MNNVFKITLAAALIMSAASTAQAESKGKITFTGLIINDTCTINIEGGGSADYTVNFPVTYPDNYGADGVAGAEKEFTMVLDNCDPGTLAGVSATFTGTTDGASTVLKKESGTAEHVGFKLYSAHNPGDREAVSFDGSRPINDKFAPFANSTTAGKKMATLKYIAEVVQVGATKPTAGDYTASATYELVYN